MGNGIEVKLGIVENEVRNLKQSVDSHSETLNEIGVKLEKGLVKMERHNNLLDQIKTTFENYQEMRDETKANTQRSKFNRKLLLGMIGIGTGSGLTLWGLISKIWNG